MQTALAGTPLYTYDCILKTVGTGRERARGGLALHLQEAVGSAVPEATSQEPPRPPGTEASPLDSGVRGQGRRTPRGLSLVLLPPAGQRLPLTFGPDGPAQKHVSPSVSLAVFLFQVTFSLCCRPGPWDLPIFLGVLLLMDNQGLFVSISGVTVTALVVVMGPSLCPHPHRGDPSFPCPC